MPYTIEQTKAQAAYMQFILDLAQEKLKVLYDDLAFDLQRRILIDVTMDRESQLKFLADLGVSVPPESTDDDVQKAIIAALGITPTKTTTVSLNFDEKNKPFINRQGLDDKLIGKISSLFDSERASLFLRLWPTLDKGSIIALQQEFHFHLGLACRVYQEIYTRDKSSPLKENEMATAYEAALLEVNKLIMAAYAKALNQAMDKSGETINLALLNKILDKARAEIAPKAHSILLQKIAKHTGVVFTGEQLKDANKIAERTTATTNDVLHTDLALGLTTLVTGSDMTAHKRWQGPHFAHRQLLTHDINEHGQVTGSKYPRIQIRTPSLPVKSGLTEQEYITDTKVKLQAVTDQYDLAKRLTGASMQATIEPPTQKPKAFIYNLYTALNDTFGDLRGNLQTQSARHILLGAHTYNSEQLDKAEKGVFCFVQAISVNGFGDALQYGSGDPLREEATLMCEMSLMHTLYDSATPAEQQKINQVMDLYRTYLGNRKDAPPDVWPQYFSQAPSGQEAMGLIKEIKEAWKQASPSPSSKDVMVNEKFSLMKLIAHDQHMSHQHALLIQSLSVCVEEGSIGGCKSGNERTQSVNGRVAIFDGKKVDDAVSELANATPSDFANRAQQLHDALDTTYNKLGLQSAASLVSLVDQGASAKIEAKPRFFQLLRSIMSRNYGEESASVMTNLHQTKAGQMQAHKGLAKLMQDAAPSTWWERMKSGPLGVIGGIIGTIIFPIAIHVHRDNQRRIELYESLQKQYQPSAQIDEPIHLSDSDMIGPLGVRKAGAGVESTKSPGPDGQVDVALTHSHGASSPPRSPQAPSSADGPQ